MPQNENRPAGAPGDSEKRAWTSPEVAELPRLTDLTLQTGPGIPGGGGSGGGTVF
ncbi:MAG: hypothetical protein JWM27_398 [Gemmatimonadetes bacterium]|nr:hypothetical protein [Gemmatimonadota bacterium]